MIIGPSKNIIKKSTIKNAEYGLFAGKDYNPGDIIEINRCIELKTACDNIKYYVFSSHMKPNHYILVLGNASIINSGKIRQNCKYYVYPENDDFIVFEATKPIKKNEEIFIYYGKDYHKSYLQ